MVVHLITFVVHVADIYAFKAVSLDAYSYFIDEVMDHFLDSVFFFRFYSNDY